MNDAIRALVERYRNLTPHQLRRMNEAQVCHSFIDPLFEALGWNVRDPDEVAFEVNIARQRADYTFRIGGVTRFIVEAKAPHRDLTNEEFKRQAVTYAYNKGVNWAVLTNFDRLLVFSAEEGQQFLNLAASDYLSAFDDLRLLSRQAVESGAFDARARRYGALRPTVPVEKSLFDQLQRWRAELFRHIDQHNPGLTTAQIDDLIQRLLNRLIFIRTAEDRHIEDNRLRAALHQWRGSGHHGDLIDRLRTIFGDFEKTYDSDLFPLPLGDPWARIFVDSDTLEPILSGLYSRPRSLAGYDFAAIDADVLGAVYEQYLGHVAVASRQRQAAAQARLIGLDSATEDTREAKRLRRKAQGIYYTPKWVVDYIVRQTVGRFVEEHTYDEILNMKILDPACGSGSFLIRAYEELLRYHARIRGKTVAELPWEDRLPVLTRNIFGVDLDDQAVQIARLNLLLRALARRESLPSLADNIRRGNSLISGDEEELRPYFGDAWREKRPFTWAQEFPEIMDRGGFDVVIGNPPYIRLHKIPGAERDWFFGRFHTARNKCDVYGFFIERCASLLQEDGRLGFIVPNTWCALDSFEPLRNFIMRTFVIEEISSLENPFHESTVSPVILLLRKTSAAEVRARNLIVHNQFGMAAGRAMPQSLRATTEIPQGLLASAPRQLVNLSWTPGYNRLTEHIASVSLPLGELCTLGFGIKTGDDSKFLVRQKSSEDDKPVLRGRNIRRYSLVWENEYVRYLPDEMKKKPIARPGDRERFEAPEKIILQGRSGRELTAAYDVDGYYTLGTTHLIRPGRREFPLKYILGLINSKLMAFWYGSQFITSTQSENELASLPIRDLTSLSGNGADIPARIVGLTERMLDLQKRKSESSLAPSEREDLEREIARADREIDELVYDLYGLTDEERRLVDEELGERYRKGAR